MQQEAGPAGRERDTDMLERSVLSQKGYSAYHCRQRLNALSMGRVESKVNHLRKLKTNTQHESI